MMPDCYHIFTYLILEQLTEETIQEVQKVYGYESDVAQSLVVAILLANEFQNKGKQKSRI